MSSHSPSSHSPNRITRPLPVLRSNSGRIRPWSIVPTPGYKSYKQACGRCPSGPSPHLRAAEQDDKPRFRSRYEEGGHHVFFRNLKRQMEIEMMSDSDSESDSNSNSDSEDEDTIRHRVKRTKRTNLDKADKIEPIKKPVHIPYEIMANIVDFCTTDTVWNLSQLNKDWHSFANPVLIKRALAIPHDEIWTKEYLHLPDRPSRHPMMCAIQNGNKVLSKALEKGRFPIATWMRGESKDALKPVTLLEWANPLDESKFMPDEFCYTVSRDGMLLVGYSATWDGESEGVLRVTGLVDENIYHMN